MQISLLIPIIILSLAGMLVAFWAFWALTGWGVSIAVRVYRWRMRRHGRYIGMPVWDDESQLERAGR